MTRIARVRRSEESYFVAGILRLLRSRGRRSICPRLSVDIGSRCTKVLESAPRGELLGVTKAICFDTPSESVANGIVRNPAAVANALRENLQAADFRATRATTCIPGPVAVLKRFKLPLTESGRLGTMVRAEVESLAAVGSDCLCVDYEVSEAFGEEALDVLVAVARRDTVRGYLDALRGAGLRPEAVDVDSLAVANAVDASAGVDPSRTIAFVHIGAEFCALGIRSHGAWAFTGSLAIGTGRVIEGHGSTPEIGAVLPAADRPVETAEVIGEVERALRFYWPESAGDPLDEILLSGGGALVPELAASLADRARCSVQLVPRLALSVSTSDTKDWQGQPHAALFTVATGLAIRALDEQ